MSYSGPDNPYEGRSGWKYRRKVGRRKIPRARTLTGDRRKATRRAEDAPKHWATAINVPEQK